MREAGLPRRLAWLLVASAVIFPFADVGVSAMIVDRVLATIDGEPVTLHELEEFASILKESRGGRVDTTANDVSRRVLEALITERIVKKEVTRRGLEAADQEVDRYLEQIRHQNNLTEEELKAAVSQQGLDWDMYREKVRFDIERSKLLAREIGEKVTVSPEEVQRYYDSHLEDYELPEQMRLWHIYIPAGRGGEGRRKARERAEECHKRVLRAKNFSDVAKQYSVGPGAEDGGDIGTIARGQMVESLEEIAFSLKQGEVSKLIEMEDGFHIFKAGKREGKRYRQVTEVGDEIREKLYDELLEERYSRWLKQDLRSRHHVEIISPLGEVEER